MLHGSLKVVQNKMECNENNDFHLKYQEEDLIPCIYLYKYRNLVHSVTNSQPFLEHNSLILIKFQICTNQTIIFRSQENIFY